MNISFKSAYKVSVYVPQQYQGVMRWLQEKFSRSYGGATILKGEGSFIGEKEEMIYDDVRIIYTFVPFEGEPIVRLIRNLHKEIRQQMLEEESVLITYEQAYTYMD